MPPFICGPASFWLKTSYGAFPLLVLLLKCNLKPTLCRINNNIFQVRWDEFPSMIAAHIAYQHRRASLSIYIQSQLNLTSCTSRGSLAEYGTESATVADTGPEHLVPHQNTTEIDSLACYPCWDLLTRLLPLLVPYTLASYHLLTFNLVNLKKKGISVLYELTGLQ